MTVYEFWGNAVNSPIKVMSAYNSKVLAYKFNVEKHIDVGKREIRSIWAEVEIKESGFSQSIKPIICVFVDGQIEVDEEVEKRKAK